VLQVGSYQSRKLTAGFTLVEMLVVITIMAMLTSAAGMIYTSVIPTFRLRSAAIDMASHLQKIRDEAVADHQVITVKIIEKGTALSINDDMPFQSLPKGVIATYRSNFSPDAGQKNSSFRIFPDGSSTGGEFTLSTGKRSVHVVINWLTGAITTNE